MRTTLFFILTSFCFLSLTPISQAEMFRSQFVSFELPDNWKCNQAPPNWICEPALASERKFALITITAKEASALDQLSSFQAHLSKPRSHQTGSNTPVISQVLKTERRVLHQQEWVQSLHLGSEVNHFYTLYLATVKSPLALMISMSAEQKKWSQFKPLFDKAIQTISLNHSQIQKMASQQKSETTSQSPQPTQSPLAASSLSDPGHSESLFGLPPIYLWGLVIAGFALLSALVLYLK